MTEVVWRCAGERKRLEKEALRPLFVAKIPEDIQLLANAVGRKAMEKAFRPNINLDLAIAGFIQVLRQNEIERDTPEARTNAQDSPQRTIEKEG